MSSRSIKNQSPLRIQLLLLLLHVLFAHCAHALLLPIDRDARTIYYHNQPPNARGNYHFEFQTTNGITIKAAGNENGSSGVVQYVSLEGVPMTWTYVADANGYQPMGVHISTIPNRLLT